MDRFGIDKPDLRYDMELVEITEVAKGKNFKVMALKGLKRTRFGPFAWKSTKKATGMSLEWRVCLGAQMFDDAEYVVAMCCKVGL